MAQSCQPTLARQFGHYRVRHVSKLVVRHCCRLADHVASMAHLLVSLWRPIEDEHNRLSAELQGHLHRSAFWVCRLRARYRHDYDVCHL